MTDSNNSAPNAVLGPFSATCIVIGAIIGIGIFFTPTNVAKITGSTGLALTAWAVGGFIALMGALTFAELGSRCRRNGGQYELLRDAWSAPVGFAYVFCNATIIQAGAIAIIAFVTAINFGVMLQGQPLANTATFAIAAIMIIGLTIANAIGIRWGSGIQNATVVAKVLTLLIITVLAVGAPVAAEVALNEDVAAAVQTASESTPLALIFAGLVPVFFSFGGWQHALWIGGEVKRPQRNIPLAIILGLVIVSIVYILVNWAYFRLLGFGGVANSQVLAADAVGARWPDLGSRVVAAAIAASGFGVLNAQLLSGPRLISGMAREGKFFPVFKLVSPRTGTPLPAIFMLGALGLTILLIARDPDRIDSLLNGVVLVDAVFFFLTGLAIFRLRQKSDRNQLERPKFLVPFYPVVPILFVIGELLVLTGAFMLEKYRNGAWIGLVWIVASLLVYAIFFRNQPEPGKADKPGKQN